MKNTKRADAAKQPRQELSHTEQRKLAAVEELRRLGATFAPNVKPSAAAPTH